jgi:type IV pilus assembly protein PilO
MAVNLKKFNDIPWYAQLGLFLIIGSIIAGTGWFFFISGLTQQIEIKQKKLDDLKVDIQRGQAVEQKHLEFQLQNKRLLDKLATLKIILPESKLSDDLLRQIQNSALNSGLTIKRFEPKGMVPKDFFSEWPINMEVEGTYHTLGIFFDKLGKLSRIVNVSNVRITQTTRGENPNRTIQASFVATTFVYNENVPDVPVVEDTKTKKVPPKAKK